MAKDDMQRFTRALDRLPEDERNSLLGNLLHQMANPGAAGDVLSNSAPAIEEGPHLKDAEIRRLKREQLNNAGLSADDDALTDDMRKMLREKGD